MFPDYKSYLFQKKLDSLSDELCAAKNNCFSLSAQLADALGSVSSLSSASRVGIDTSTITSSVVSTVDASTNTDVKLSVNAGMVVPLI